MHGDKVRLLQQGVEIGNLSSDRERAIRAASIVCCSNQEERCCVYNEGYVPAVAEGQLGDDVVEDHAHAQGLGHHRQLRADVAVPDDAQGLATDFVTSLSRLRHAKRKVRPVRPPAKCAGERK